MKPGLVGLALLVSVVAGQAARAQDPEAETSVAGDAWLGIGYYFLPSGGGEDRFEASYQLGQVGLRPLRSVVTATSGGAFEVGGLARVEGLVFSSREYDGYRLQPGLGLDLLWSDTPTSSLFYSLTLRPYAAYSFERSEIADDGLNTMDTFLVGVELAASFYRLAPLLQGGEEAAARSALRWFPEAHMRVAYEHDLDPADTAEQGGPSPVATSEARRRVGRSGSSGGTGTVVGGSGAGGVVVLELQDEERDLSSLTAELTGYLLTIQGTRFSLAAGAVAGLRQHRAAFYLTEQAGSPIHTLYGGPVLRLGLGAGVYAFVSATARWEIEVDRLGGGGFGGLLWSF